MFGMNRYKILKCFRKEMPDFRQAVLSGNRSYCIILLNKNCAPTEIFLLLFKIVNKKINMVPISFSCTWRTIL